MHFHFTPRQCYQIPGGFRCRIVSATPDEDELDLLLVVEVDGELPEHLKLVIEPMGGRQHLVAASDFYGLKPELLH